MKKRVFIVHGWEGHPEEGWFPWLKKELENKGFEVTIPELPESSKPRIHNWVPTLQRVVGKIDEDTYFVGHSMGCQTIARLLESLPDNQIAGGAVFVAGFFKRLTGLGDDPEVLETDQHWLTTPINLEKVKKHLKKSTAIFSTDDPFVPLDNADDFHNILGSEIIIEKNMRHFSGSSGMLQLSIVRDVVLELAS